MTERPEVPFERNASTGGQYSVTWKGPDEDAHSAVAVGISVSSSGVVIACSRELPQGCTVFVECRDGSVQGECEVISCTREGALYNIGLAFLTENMWKPGIVDDSAECEPDYYEALQISRKADSETIHRVYRIMAARFHPDNPETGDLEIFLQMKMAYTVLSDPERRADYDQRAEKDREGPRPIFGRKAFVTGVEAEANRRLGVLALLYNQRQSDPDHPSVGLLELEKEMGFPREYLNFTMWFLRQKEFVAMADNSDFAITAGGAEYLEKKAARNEIVGNLLNQAAARAQRTRKTAKDRPRTRIENQRYLLT